MACSHIYSAQSDFIKSPTSPWYAGNDGYTMVCKTCATKLFQQYIDVFSGNKQHALIRICQQFDVYYDDELAAKVMSETVNDALLAVRYTDAAASVASRRKSTVSKCYIHTLEDEQAGLTGQVRLSNKEREILEKSEDALHGITDDFKVTPELIRAWGPGFTDEQYKYLQDEYADWTAKNVCNTKAQEELFRNIVLAQLDVRTARQRGGKVAEAQKALQDLMNSANILPKQTADNVLADTQTFGTLLKKYEETRPIPEPAEEWRDVDKIRLYMDTYFRGGLAKALKLKTATSALYDEAVKEMARYTVEPQTQSLSADVTGASSIFEDAEPTEKPIGGDQ